MTIQPKEVFSQLKEKLEAAAQETTGADQAILNANMHLEQGIMLVRHMTTKKTWETLDVDSKNVFLRRLALFLGTQQQRINLFGLKTCQYLDPNKCRSCQEQWVWDILVKEDMYGWYSRPVPYPEHIDDWVKWRTMSPYDIAKYATNILGACCETAVNESNIMELRGRVELMKDMAPICYWEAKQVAFIAECIMHARHPQNVEFEFFTMVGGIYGDKCYKDLVGKDHKWKWKHQKMFILDQKEGLFCLMCFEKETRQVVIWDGTEKDVRKNKTAEKAAEDIEVFWHKNAKDLLELFGELSKPKQLLYTLHLNTENTTEPVEKQSEQNWSISSVTRRYPEEWNDRLISQGDGYHSGAVALMHLLMVLGETVEVQFQTFLQTINFGILCQKWVRDCTKKGDLPKEFNVWYDPPQEEISQEAGTYKEVTSLRGQKLRIFPAGKTPADLRYARLGLLAEERKDQKRLAALSGDKSDMEVSDAEDGEIKEGSELALTPMVTGTGEGTTSEFGTGTAKVQDVLITDVDEKQNEKTSQESATVPLVVRDVQSHEQHVTSASARTLPSEVMPTASKVGEWYIGTPEYDSLIKNSLR